MEQQNQSRKNGCIGCLAILVIILLVFIISQCSIDNNKSNTTTTYNSSIYTSTAKPNTESYSSNTISLYYGGESILCGTTEDNIKDLIKCLTAKDEVGWNEMFSLGKAFTVPSNTKAIVLERKLTVIKVRISEGAYKDKIAWVVSEAVK